jgi:hypothetical protein
MDYKKTYTIQLTGSDLDRIQFVFREEEQAYLSNEPSEANTGLLEQTRSVLKKVNQTIKEAA